MLQFMFDHPWLVLAALWTVAAILLTGLALTSPYDPEDEARRQRLVARDWNAHR